MIVSSRCGLVESKATGAPMGFLGPVALTIPLAVDAAVAALPTVVVGGNEVDVHFQGVVPGRDFPLDKVLDLRNAEAGDPCPRCGTALEVKHGIEIGHVFKLGTKYSQAMGATVRLGGQVAVGSVKRGDGVSDLEFDVTDGTAIVHVVSRGVPPQLFRDRIGVVVEGTMTSAGTFESQRLMVSHDNQYRAPGDRNVDVKTLMRSTQGIDDPPAPQPVVAGPGPR